MVRLPRPALASVVRMADMVVTAMMVMLRVLEKRLDCGILHAPQPGDQVSANFTPVCIVYPDGRK